MKQVFQCVSRGPIFVRIAPDDNSQVISVVRPGHKIEVVGFHPGMVYHLPPVEPTLEDGVWMQFEKGYVRSQSMDGTIKYFKEYNVQIEYPDADSSLQPGDIVMIKQGTTDAYYRPLRPSWYAPTEHVVCVLDSSKYYALLGYPNGIATWIPISNLVLVRRAPSPYRLGN